ncbi:MAG: TMEM175 family protein [Coriobacteriia bacterium]
MQAVRTDLKLELPIPAASVTVWPALVESWRDFLAYLIGFAFIGGIWLGHATLTKVMKRGDMATYSMNIVCSCSWPYSRFPRT